MASDRTAEELKMNAYYYSFRPTGVYEIDKILSEIVSAGKAYHSTEDWNNDDGPWLSPVEKIQAAADNAAKIWKILWVDGKF